MPWHLTEAAIGGLTALALSMAAVAYDNDARPAGPGTVRIGPSVRSFPEPGEFLAEGRPVAAPLRTVEVPRFEITRHQVSLADYGRCVSAGRCAPADAPPADRPADVPVTGVSFLDAMAYAGWLSDVTGETWRLPTALEAAAAAGERFSADTFADAADDPANPAVAWLRRYREEAALARRADPVVHPFGSRGFNALGVADFGGNVWEWTSTCYVRVTVSADRLTELHRTENCRVHVLEGRHRAIMSDFVRDGRSGGCAVGTPPDNLGFRLVRETGWTAPLARLGRRLAALALRG